MNFDTEFARENMLQQQIRCWDVFSPHVLDALRNIPREHFVPEQYADLAFADTMLPLGNSDTDHAQKMLSPKLEGRILQELNIQSTDCALVIGTGSGYLTACLARLARHVTSIDVSTTLIDTAGKRLDELGIANVDLRVQDMFDRPAAARFDVIVVTGSLPVYDSRIDTWLKPGGRAFVVIGTAPAMEACRIERSVNDEITYKSLFETVIPPLVNSKSEERFSF